MVANVQPLQLTRLQRREMVEQIDREKSIVSGKQTWCSSEQSKTQRYDSSLFPPVVGSIIPCDYIPWSPTSPVFSQHAFPSVRVHHCSVKIPQEPGELKRTIETIEQHLHAAP